MGYYAKDERRRVTGIEIQVGDLVYVPWGDVVIEVTGTRRETVMVDGAECDTVVLSGHVTTHGGRGVTTWTDNCRQTATGHHRLTVIGDVRVPTGDSLTGCGL